MRHLMLATPLVLTLALGVTQAPAEEPPAPGTEDGRSLIERGAQLLLEGFAREIEPAMRDMAEGMEDLAVRLQPMMAELARLIDDLSAYELPERLPNGDIIIRRKPQGAPGSELGENGETEL